MDFQARSVGAYSESRRRQPTNAGLSDSRGGQLEVPGITSPENVQREGFRGGINLLGDEAAMDISPDQPTVRRPTSSEGVEIRTATSDVQKSSRFAQPPGEPQEKGAGS